MSTNWISSTITNLAISIFTALIFVVKTAVITRLRLYPFASVLLYGSLATLWCLAFCAQLSSDTTNPAHHTFIPWYLMQSCSVVEDSKGYSACQLAQATFFLSASLLWGLSSILTCVFLTNISDIYVFQFVWACFRSMVQVHAQKKKEALEFFSHSPSKEKDEEAFLSAI